MWLVTSVSISKNDDNWKLYKLDPLMTDTAFRNSTNNYQQVDMDMETLDIVQCLSDLNQKKCNFQVTHSIDKTVISEFN